MTIEEKLKFPHNLQKGQKKKKTNFEEKILEVTRITKVVKGGKILSFRAIVVIGNRKGKVGVGIGKGDNVNLAVDKAILSAKKYLLQVPLTNEFSVPHSIHASYGAAIVNIEPRRLGTGVIAGGAVRPVLELAGIRNVFAKQLGGKNLGNNSKAAITALLLLNQKIESREFQLFRNGQFYENLLKTFTDKKNKKIRKKRLFLRALRIQKEKS